MRTKLGSKIKTNDIVDVLEDGNFYTIEEVRKRSTTSTEFYAYGDDFDQVTVEIHFDSSYTCQ